MQLLFCSCAYQKYTLVQFHLNILSWLWYHRYGFNLFDYQHRSKIYSVSYKIQPVTVQNSRVSFHTRPYYCIESCQKHNVPAALILRSNYKTRLGSQFKAFVKNSARILGCSIHISFTIACDENVNIAIKTSGKDEISFFPHVIMSIPLSCCY